MTLFLKQAAIVLALATTLSLVVSIERAGAFGGFGGGSASFGKGSAANSSGNNGTCNGALNMSNGCIIGLIP